MKKNCFLIVLVFILILSSCEKNESQIISYDVENTLKSIITEKENETLWTKEIEPEILEESINSLEGIANNLTLSQETTILNKAQRCDIYPSISNFTIINTSDYDKDILNLIQNLSKEICNDLAKTPVKFINPDYLFVYTFFKSNLLDNWYEMFNEEFTFTFEELNGNKKITFFNDYLIGKYEESNDYLIVPVRFYTENNYVNTRLYIEKENNKSISNIEITGWGRKNER